MDTPQPECEHKDTERVGAYEIVCYNCKRIADWRDLMAGRTDAWRPIVEGKKEQPHGQR